MSHDNRRRNVSGGMSLPSVILLVFIILKLTKVISWSWLWVLSPLWIGASLGLVFFLVIGMILLTAVIGIANENSRMISGIKGWFQRKKHDDNYDTFGDES